MVPATVGQGQADGCGSMSQAIYPVTLADRLKARVGEKYQPSNGTEGLYFFEAWCMRCARDKSMSEGKDYDLCTEDETCSIIANTMAYKPEDDEYPKEWQYDKDGQPCCMAFVLAGNAIPQRDDLTVDMFGSQS